MVLQVSISQTKTSVVNASGLSVPMMKGDKFDTNDKQQSVVNTDFLGMPPMHWLKLKKEPIFLKIE